MKNNAKIGELGKQRDPEKFRDPFVTASGETRARVELSNPQTLWFNTGTLCNIECENCYILSSPKNDALIYLTAHEVEGYLDQISERRWPVRDIAFTGGEPFMNPQICDMARLALERGYEVLILTNAMRPMMRKSVRAALEGLIAQYRDKLVFRISLDHWSARLHDQIRGEGSFAKTLAGMIWLRDAGARLAVAGRSIWGESEAHAREGYAALYQEKNFNIDAHHPVETMIFPEMNEGVDVPEITTSCWEILDKSPQDMMCASARMVVRRKGAAHPVVVSCTLLPYAAEFELGETLEQAETAVQLNHPHCAKFCVLGGAKCSA